jgi:ATP-dependent DNA helicase PIF1
MTPFDRLRQEIETGSNVYISGVGGCGKTYVLKKLHEWFAKRKKCVLSSTTGISAYNLGGITIHSWCKIVIPSMVEDVNKWAQQLVQKLQRRHKVRSAYLSTEILFVDEVSMLGANYLDVLNYVCQQLRCCTKPFGGLQLVLSGDMMQLPPVKDDFPFESASWSCMGLTYFRLTKAWRFDNQTWVDLLHRVRLGQLTQDDKLLLRTRLKKFKPTLGEGVQIPPVFLSSTNDVVDEINTQRLAEHASDLTEVVAHDFLGVKDDEDRIVQLQPLNVPEEVSKQFMADSSIKLKVGAQVMLLANLDVDKGFTNGTRGVVKKVQKSQSSESSEPTIPTVCIGVEFETGYLDVQMHQFMVDVRDVTYVRLAVPLRLAFATSIHKSQSLTLSSVEVDIGTKVFSEGQSYVALSRCKSLEGLYIRALDFSKIRPHPKALEFEMRFLNECIDL